MDIHYIREELTMANAEPAESAAPDIEMLAGSASEVRKRLHAGDPGQIVVLRLRNNSKTRAAALVDAFKLIGPMIVDHIADREKDTLEKLMDALVPQVPPPVHLITEARMNAEAHRAVLESADWLTAAQLSQIAGFAGQNASAQPNKWKREGKVFAIRRNGSDYFPGYALDPETHYRPVKGLAPILTLFADELDEWDIATWFASANSFLGGAMPKDLLLMAPEQVLAAAQDEMAGVLHG
jgi:hypothetical protein